MTGQAPELGVDWWHNVHVTDESLPPDTWRLRLHAAWAAIRGRSVVYRVVIEDGARIIAICNKGGVSTGNNYVRSNRTG